MDRRGRANNRKAAAAGETGERDEGRQRETSDVDRERDRASDDNKRDMHKCVSLCLLIQCNLSLHDLLTIPKQPFERRFIHHSTFHVVLCNHVGSAGLLCDQRAFTEILT